MCFRPSVSSQTLSQYSPEIGMRWRNKKYNSPNHRLDFPTQQYKRILRLSLALKSEVTIEWVWEVFYMNWFYFIISKSTGKPDSALWLLFTGITVWLYHQKIIKKLKQGHSVFCGRKKKVLFSCEESLGEGDWCMERLEKRADL